METSGVSPRGKVVSPQSFPSHFSATRTTTLTCFDFSSFCLGENTTSKPHPLLFFLVFCLDCFFFCLFVLSCLWMCGCVLGVCVFLCVFSPAASVDYGSFADRCSTWLELLRLKAHTIRRGSVKTSRRTHSLVHSGDHTYKFTRSSCIRAHIHPHTPPCMLLGAEHYQSSNQALAFLIECESWSPTLKNQPKLRIHDDKIICKKSIYFLHHYVSWVDTQMFVREAGKHWNWGLWGKGFLQSLVWF